MANLPQQRNRRGTLDNHVPIPTALRLTAGIESGRRACCIPHRNISRKMGIEGCDKGPGLMTAAGHKCCHLPQGMHAGISPAGPFEPVSLSCDVVERPLQDFLDRQRIVLNLEPAVSGSIVLNQQRQFAAAGLFMVLRIQHDVDYSTNSNCTRGAASPLRKPIFMMRV